MKKLILFLFMACWMGMISCAAAAGWWVCERCGETENYFNYCTGCGMPRTIDSWLNADSTDGIRREYVSFDRIDASSYITNKKDPYLYEPWRATDGDVSTRWQFSAKKGLQEKAWIALELEGETIDEIWLRNGLQYTNDNGRYLYEDYSRLKDIRVVFYDNNDETESMCFTLSDDNATGWERIITGRHEHVVGIIIYIDTIYQGTSNADTVCLTELMLVKTLTDQPSSYHDGSHIWRKEHVTQPATYFGCGTKEWICRVCGETQQEAFYPEGTLRLDDQGEAVKTLQRKLNETGYSCGKADGKYGVKTEQAVRLFEKDHDLAEDGVAWPGVIALLNGEVLPLDAGDPFYEALSLTVTIGSIMSPVEAGDIMFVEWMIENPLDSPLTDWTLTYSVMDEQVLMVASGFVLDAHSQVTGTWTHEVEDSEIWWANERGEGLFSPGFYAQGYDQDERVAYSNDVDYYMTVSELSYN